MEHRDTNTAPPRQVSALLTRAKVPGACIALARRGEQTELWAHGEARLAPPRPAGTDTVFHLFSGTKLYTATAVMRLVEQGRASLDDPVQAHLPELPLRRPISIRQLACHDSGLPDTLRAFLATRSPSDPAPSTAEALGRYSLDKGKAPGRGAAYRNVNYAILGELISRVSGRPYTHFVRDEVLDPLGSQAAYSYSAERLARAAAGYIPRFSPMRLALRVVMPSVSRRIYGPRVKGLVELVPYELDTAAIGGLVGAAGDFVPLLREMLDPEDAVLSAASKREMLTLQAKGRVGIESREGAGIGWKLGSVAGVEFWNHEGGGAGFCSETRLYPGERLGIVILMNLNQSMKLSGVAHQICEALRRA